MGSQVRVASLTLEKDSQSGLQNAWEYDSYGRLKSATGGGMRYEYRYDALGRLKEKQASGRALLSIAYDLDGNRTSVTDLIGKTTRYTYDRNGRLLEVRDGENSLAAYRYSPSGMPEGLRIGKDLTTTYRYDTDQNLVGMKTSFGDRLLADNHYGYDGNANRIRKETLDGITDYRYDGNNRLVEVRCPNREYMESYSYDRAGNRTERSRGDVKTQYVYDCCNRLMEERTTGIHPEPQVVTYTYDRQGNLLTDGRGSYTYDGLGHLETAQMKDGSMQHNHYDAEGLRHEMEENGKLVKFLFNENREVITEENEEGKRIRYIRGLGLVCSDSEKARGYYHYASDELGSVTHVFSGRGEVLNHYGYDARNAGNMPSEYHQRPLPQTSNIEEYMVLTLFILFKLQIKLTY